MKKKLSILLVVAFVIVGVSAFFTADAQGLTAPSNPGGLLDFSRVKGGSGGVAGLIIAITNLVLGVAGAIAILFVIIGGFQYILSGANEDLAKRGKATLTNAIIGLIIIVLSFTVISVVYTTLTNVQP